MPFRGMHGSVLSGILKVVYGADVIGFQIIINLSLWCKICYDSVEQT